MKYKGYEGAVKFDEEANIFHGEVLNTRDVITLSGNVSSRTPKGFSRLD